MVILKNRSQIEKVRTSAKIVAELLSYVRAVVKPNITTNYLNNAAEEIAYKYNATSGFKNYKGFPYSVCASIDDIIVHGFPNDVPLKEGSILSLDFGILKDGFYGDAAITVPVGKVSDSATKLIKTTEECLYSAIDVIKPGIYLSDVSNVIQQHAESNGYCIIKDYVGHGIGKDLHEFPQVPNYGVKGKGVLLKAGMLLCVEPMLVIGKCKTKRSLDGWTVRTSDGSLAAHFEHTVLVTDEGCEILSLN